MIFVKICEMDAANAELLHAFHQLGTAYREFAETQGLEASTIMGDRKLFRGQSLVHAETDVFYLRVTDRVFAVYLASRPEFAKRCRRVQDVRIWEEC